MSLANSNLLAELSGKAMNVLQRASSIRGVRELANEEIRRLETEWNGVFTKLGVVQGQLKARRKELADRAPCCSTLSRLFRPTRRPAAERCRTLFPR